MIGIDFFGCKRDQIVTCSWEDACDRFPCTGITLPDASALASLSEALTGSRIFSAELVALPTEQFYELSQGFTAALRKATPDDLKDAGARWTESQPWKRLDTNGMDLAGFLLHLQWLVAGPEKKENSIFLWVESSRVPPI